MKANDIRFVGHPLHHAFLRFVKNNKAENTKRQARKFLQKYPQYRKENIVKR